MCIRDRFPPEAGSPGIPAGQYAVVDKRCNCDIVATFGLKDSPDCPRSLGFRQPHPAQQVHVDEMRRQRQEMKRQRRYMRLQWKTMGEQAKLTAGQVAEMKEQTDVLGKSVKATQDNAAAAKANADALINSERAWVIAELRHNARQDKAGRWYHEDGVPFTVAEVLAGNHLLYRLRITNMGRTPAHIFSFEIRYACLLEGVKDLPENPPTQKTDFHEFIHLLTPGKTFEILDDINVEQYMRGDWDNITRLEKTAVFYGCVKYRHMFSTENDNPQSDFCYVYTVDLSRLSSVGRHTRYT